MVSNQYSCCSWDYHFWSGQEGEELRGLGSRSSLEEVNGELGWGKLGFPWSSLALVVEMDMRALDRGHEQQNLGSMESWVLRTCLLYSGGLQGGSAGCPTGCLVLTRGIVPCIPIF
jgi:hypothetical protein